MADLPLHQRVYLKQGSCSCRACGLEWKSHQLQPCPRCNETSLHSEAVKLQERVDQLELEAMVARDMLMDAYMDELKIDKDKAHAMVDFDFGNRLAAEDDPTTPQQHPDNGGIT